MLIEAGGGSSRKPKPRHHTGNGGGGGWPSPSGNQNNRARQEHEASGLPEWHTRAPSSRVVSPEEQRADNAGPWYKGLDAQQFLAATSPTRNPVAKAFDPEYQRDLQADAERKAALGLQHARQEREAALSPEKTLKPADAEPMTWHEYNLLSPQQRAAVDFNTMLVRAVRKDLHTNYKPSSAERVKYDEFANEMFGNEGRASTEYAPETLGLLRQIDFKDKRADLDDFLDLRAAISAEDLKDIPLLGGSPGAVQQSGFSPSREEQVTLHRELATSTQKLESQLAEGNKLINSITTIAAEDRDRILGVIGGTMNTGTAKGRVGFMPPKFDTGPGGEQVPTDANSYFIDAYDKLARAEHKGDEGGILADVRAQLEPRGLYGEFIGYLNDRSNNALQFGQDLEASRGVKYKTPEQFRKLLGLGRGAE